jgi:hypothetical protein
VISLGIAEWIDEGTRIGAKRIGIALQKCI